MLYGAPATPALYLFCVLVSEILCWHGLSRLERGADASLQDADGHTALDRALSQVGPFLHLGRTL